MVDVGAKPPTERLARASGFVRLSREAVAALDGNRLAKGDALAAARLAGIQAAKRTSDWIPLCHPLSLTHARVELTLEPEGVRIGAEVKTVGPTGVEMEALTAVAGAALTLYDMVKAVDRGAVIEAIALEEKSGGRSGHYRRPAGSAAARPASARPATDAGAAPRPARGKSRR